MEVLKTLYNRTCSLEEYLRCLPGCPDNVVQQNDKPGYKAFLQNTIVGIPSGTIPLQEPISYLQLSEQFEVVLRVIKKLSEQTKTGKNVLLIGWQQTPRRMRTDNVSCDTGHFLPGNTTGQLKMPHWKTLLRRIGDMVMMHILCDLSVFVKAPPSCLIQLTGTPVYDLASKSISPEQSLHQSDKSTVKSNHVKETANGKRKKRKHANIDGQSDQPRKRQCKGIPESEQGVQHERLTQTQPPVSLSQNSGSQHHKQEQINQHASQNQAAEFERMHQRRAQSQQCVSMNQNSGPESQHQRHTQSQQSVHQNKTLEIGKQIMRLVATQEPSSSALKYSSVKFDKNKLTNLQRCNLDIRKQLTDYNQPKNQQNKHTVSSGKSKKTSKSSAVTDEDHHSVWKHVPDKKFSAVDMCYGHGGRERLPKSHPMECLQLSSVGARQLTGSIFNINSINKEYKEDSNKGESSKSPDVAVPEVNNHGGVKMVNGKTEKKLKKKPKLTPKRYLRAQKLIHTMLAQHRKTGIFFLLKYHCPLDVEHLKQTKEAENGQDENKPSVQDALKQQSGDGAQPNVYFRRPPQSTTSPSQTDSGQSKKQPSLSSMATPSWRIYLFIRSILDRVVPHQLWGSMHNRKVFFQFVRRYLELGRYERLSLHQLVDDIQLCDCEWAVMKMDSPRPPSDVIKQHQMVANFFAWLMEKYVITLVKTMFYVTECSFSKNQLLFFRKPLWHKLEKTGADKLQDAGIIKPISQVVATDMMKAEMSLGCSNLRFVPKTTSLRPIVNMGKCSLPSKQTLSVNMLLQDLFDVLTYIKSEAPDVIGSAILGTDAIYTHWKQFVQRHKQGAYSSQPLYFVKLDIEKCYESITHDKLFKIINTLLKSHPGNFLIRRYAIVTLQQGKLQRAFHRHVSVIQDVGSDFHRTLIGLAKDNQLKNAVIINQVSQHVSTPLNLLSRLKQHVKHDILKCGGQHYQRISGISQGSVISALLCSYFYAHMEKCCLSGIGYDGLLLHLVDDFLLVTPHADKAHRFLHVLLKGLPQYGCVANPAKTLTNFPFTHEGTSIPSIQQGDLFPWCGLLFDTKGLHVNNDYSRYHGIRVRYTLTIDTYGDVFLALKNKLKKSLQAKDICLFMDPLVNSTNVIILNIYHMLLMLAFRFHAYYSNLTSQQKTSVSASYLSGLILNISDHFYNMIFNKLSSHDALLPGKYFPLAKSSMEWLCLKAFKTKLSKHETTYKALLKMIMKQRNRLSQTMDPDTVIELQSCCTPDIPYDFTQMI